MLGNILLVRNVLVGTRSVESVTSNVEEYPVPAGVDRPKLPETELDERPVPMDDGREPAVALLVSDGSKLLTELPGPTVDGPPDEAPKLDDDSIDDAELPPLLVTGEVEGILPALLVVGKSVDSFELLEGLPTGYDAESSEGANDGTVSGDP